MNTLHYTTFSVSCGSWSRKHVQSPTFFKSTVPWKCILWYVNCVSWKFATTGTSCWDLDENFETDHEWDWPPVIQSKDRQIILNVKVENENSGLRECVSNQTSYHDCQQFPVFWFQSNGQLIELELRITKNPGLRMILYLCYVEFVSKVLIGEHRCFCRPCIYIFFILCCLSDTDQRKRVMIHSRQSWS